MRFVLEVVQAVRAAVGSQLPIVYRISGDEHQDGGLSLADVCALVPHLEAAGVDLVDVSAGMYETNWWITQPMEMPQGVLAPLARQVRQHAQVPVSVSGRITDPSVAEHLIASGVCDFVTLGRALHADPDFPAKAKSGRTSEICTCIACNQGCSDLHARGLPIVCLVNTHTGRERENAIRPAAPRKRITVVGGGPAGLEAARVLALRGHTVTLHERDAEPGGQMLLSRQAPGREEFAGHLPWLAGAAARAGATLHFGQAVTAAQVLAAQPDVVVVATGAHLGLPAIPGVQDSPVVDADAVLRRPRSGGGRVLVLGGGIRGVAVARVLAPRSAAVVLVDAADELLADIATRSRRFQLQALEDLPNVTVHTGTTVERLGATEAELSRRGTRWTVAIDLVVPTATLLPSTELADELLDLQPELELHLVGDCAAPRGALEAMHEAAALAHRL
jgi:NADPH-dependent 2,4-dienoyl-CoA reductase/sulfur reductase-like enzyme